MDENDQRILLKHHGKVSTLEAESFPDGNVYMKAIRAHGVDPVSKDEDYWTASARWALLQRFGLWDDTPETDERIGYRKDTATGKSVLEMSDSQQHIVSRQWKECCQRALSNKRKKTLRSADTSPSQPQNDLLEFLQTGKSNGRTLEFASLEIKPGYSLHCHAHPNLELAYCARGSLHEVRAENTYVPPQNEDEDDTPSLDVGALSTETLGEGEWLVNSVGSIHKSFTCPKEGCLLILLFGGSEAELDEHGYEHRLQKAMQVIDPKMSLTE